MRALVFQDVKQLGCESIADAAIVEPGDAVVQVRLAAVCGSDLHIYRGHEAGLDAGTAMGHEFVGEVVAVGKDVERIQVGDQVLAPFTTSCGDCFYCRGGLTARCERGQLFGWVEKGQGLHGGQAEAVRVPMADSTLERLPDGVPVETALLAGDVLSTGCFGAERAGAGPGATIAVIGCGPVGLMAVFSAVRLGAARVFAIDRVPERLEQARELGAEPVDFAAVSPPEVLRQATHGRGADGVVEAVGTPQATRAAVDLVRPGGTIAAVGVHNEPQFALSPGEAYDKNLTYVAGRCSARHYMDRVIPWLRDGVDLSGIFSHRLSLEEGVHAYRIFDEKLEGCTKVLLKP